jgi:hypothetical protein
VGEDVATADLAEQEPFGCLIKKRNQVPGKGTCTPEPKAQGEVLKKGA